MSKFILSSAGRRVGVAPARKTGPRIPAGKSNSALYFQERTVTAGTHKGSVEIFCLIGEKEYYLDVWHTRPDLTQPWIRTDQICLYRFVKRSCYPIAQGRDPAQFWTKTPVADGGFLLNCVLNKHLFLRFGDDGKLLVGDVGDVFHATFIAETAAAAAPVAHPEVAEAPAAPLDPIVLAEQQISEREERVRILTERLAAVQVAEQQLAAMLSI